MGGVDMFVFTPGGDDLFFCFATVLPRCTCFAASGVLALSLTQAVHPIHPLFPSTCRAKQIEHTRGERERTERVHQEEQDSAIKNQIKNQL